jgi:hypothetical protein
VAVRCARLAADTPQVDGELVVHGRQRAQDLAQALPRQKPDPRRRENGDFGAVACDLNLLALGDTVEDIGEPPCNFGRRQSSHGGERIRQIRFTQ